MADSCCPCCALTHAVCCPFLSRAMSWSSCSLTSSSSLWVSLICMHAVFLPFYHSPASRCSFPSCLLIIAFALFVARRSFLVFLLNSCLLSCLLASLVTQSLVAASQLLPWSSSSETNSISNARRNRQDEIRQSTRHMSSDV